MPKKKAKIPKSGPVWHRSAEEATLDQMPRYNAHLCKTGPHGNAKYDRASAKRRWQRDMARESARDCGRFPFLGVLRGSLRLRAPAFLEHAVGYPPHQTIPVVWK